VSLCTGRKRALLIGINYFGNKQELKGCVNDVKNLKYFLTAYNRFREGDVVVLTDDQRDPKFIPNRANIIAAMYWLVNNPRENDSYFFHYSGHGGQVPDLDGDESDGYDETILPVDWESAGQIIDDEMHDIMVRPLPPGVRLTAIFDSCHSGTALDLPYVYASDGTLISNKLLKDTAGTLTEAGKFYMVGDTMGALKKVADSFKIITQGKQAQEFTQATKTSMADVVMFSGCKDSQTSADTNIEGLGSTGAMSFAFIAAMSEHPRVSYLHLLNRMREILRGKYSQKPQLSSGRPMDMNTIFYL